MNSGLNTAVSVVMTTYNGEKYLAAQLESVLCQLRETDELVVVDDASSDGSVALLLAQSDARIKLHRNPVNLGVRSTFEQALRHATHDIIFLCDQDDVWLPGKRDAFVEAFLRDPATVIVVSDAEVIDAQGTVIAAFFMASKGGFRSSLWQTLIRNTYLGCAMALRRSLLDTILPIPANVPMHDMWFGAMGTLTGKVAYLPTPYLQYRRHGQNASPFRPQGIVQMIKWRATLAALVARRWLAVKLGTHQAR